MKYKVVHIQRYGEHHHTIYEGYFAETQAREAFKRLTEDKRYDAHVVVLFGWNGETWVVERTVELE
jgi:hypothetical protein